LNEVQKASFSLEHDVRPDSYKKTITDKKGKFKDFQFEDSRLSFGLQTDHNLAETVIHTFSAQNNWFSIGFFAIHL
jgi:hypothetical protein